MYHKYKKICHFRREGKGTEANTQRSFDIPVGRDPKRTMSDLVFSGRLVKRNEMRVNGISVRDYLVVVERGRAARHLGGWGRGEGGGGGGWVGSSKKLRVAILLMAEAQRFPVAQVSFFFVCLCFSLFERAGTVLDLN